MICEPPNSLTWTVTNKVTGASVTLTVDLHPLEEGLRKAEDFCLRFLGHQCAIAGEPRNWSMPDAWHRGYLAGRLQLKKA